MRVTVRIDTDNAEQAKAVRAAELIHVVADCLGRVGLRDGLMNVYVYDKATGRPVNEYGLICNAEID